MNIGKFIISFVAGSMLFATNAFSFDASSASGALDQVVNVQLISSPDGSINERANALLESDKFKKHGYGKAARVACGIIVAEESANKIAPVVITFASAVANYLFSQYSEKVIKNTENIKKRTLASYSSQVVVDEAELKGANCAVVTRYHKKTKELGLLAVLKLENHHGKAFTFTPALVYVKKSVAETKATKKDSGEAPSIAASIAIAVTATTPLQSGIVSLGESAVNVNDLKIGQGAMGKVCNHKEGFACAASSLIAYPASGEVAL